MTLDGGQFKVMVARSGFSLVWRRRNQLLAGYIFKHQEESWKYDKKINSGVFLFLMNFKVLGNVFKHGHDINT